MAKFKYYYRIESTRLPSWDYARNATYFITICAKYQRPYFGRIIDNGQQRGGGKNGVKNMQLSKIGEIADACWLAIPEHFPFVKLGAHIVMPDHVHGIIIMDKISVPGNAKNNTSNRPSQKNRFDPQSQNLASVIRGYKCGVTKEARKIDPDFTWLPRFYDSIIWDRSNYDRVEKYIRNNPKNWKNR